MLNIDLATLKGLTYTSERDPKHSEWVCIGYGSGKDAIYDYVVGLQFDSVSNRTFISTHLFKDVQFKGAITIH